eukprot:862323-Amphidinium_carterae.1
MVERCQFLPKLSNLSGPDFCPRGCMHSAWHCGKWWLRSQGGGDVRIHPARLPHTILDGSCMRAWHNDVHKQAKHCEPRT